MIIAFIGYTVARGIIQAEDMEVEKRILKYTGITVGSIMGVIAAGYFFGVIGIIMIPIVVWW